MSSTDWKTERTECPSCGSERGLATTKDGRVSFCHRCEKTFKNEDAMNATDQDDVHMDKGSRTYSSSGSKHIQYKYQFLGVRGVHEKTFRFFGCKVGINPENNEPEILQFPHPNGRILNKRLDRKEFFWTGEKLEGDTAPLFGMDKFAPGSAKAITITEGALDTCSAYEMQGSQYPVVSVTSASSAKRECGLAFNYLNSFDKIYICFDNDMAGKDAAKAVARLFDFNKVYVVELKKKDANDYIMEKLDRDFQKLWWAAQRFMPEGILASYAEFDKIIDDDLEKPAVPYPFPRMQDMTYGARTGELVLLTAQEGIGKTEILRALEYHFLKTTDDNIGIIHLEENKARTIKGLVGYELESPIHLPDRAIPKDEIKKVFRNLTKRDERVHVYSHYGSDDPDVILSTVRFMAGACGCKRVFLDHITMVVSGLAGDDERRALDYISTRLAMMTEELDFTLFLISHVNDEGQTRGSRNIGKVADLRIDMNRDLETEDPVLRNTTFLKITKNRYAGRTGPAGQLYFDPDTYVLKEMDPDDVKLPF